MVGYDSLVKFDKALHRSIKIPNPVEARIPDQNITIPRRSGLTVSIIISALEESFLVSIIGPF